MIRKWFVLAAAAALIGASACGGSDGDGDGGGGGSTGGDGKLVVCELFTVAEIEAVLGNAVVEPTPAQHVCNWMGADALQDRDVTMVVHPHGASDFDATVDAVEGMDNTTVAPISGVGDQAVLSTFQLEIAGFVSSTAQVIATEGDALVHVTVGQPSLPTQELEQATRELTLQLLQKIK